jgi:hypothetical protein
VCLQVRGCRHRSVEYLITMGHDLQKKNAKVENFIETLQLAQNRKLLKELIEYETIRIHTCQS